MGSFAVNLPSGQQCEVEVIRKQMSTCRLKVYPDGSVSLSLPERADDEWAIAFLQEKAPWIEKKLELFKKTAGYSSTKEIQTGYSITMLGQDLVFNVKKSDCNSVVQEGKTICILSQDINDQGLLLKTFQAWWRKQALQIIQQRVDYWYPVIRKYGVAQPKIYIRKMSTLWGSCSANRGAVTFNQYLIKAKIACIDYVVLHELTHFIYPNHSKLFYDFLSSYMPDWKERKNILDQDVVHGL